MSEVKVNKISPRTACGTVTLGDSGDTFTIPSGATITNSGTATGFGATGAVNWDTASIKTATFTAVSGSGYFCNTTGGVLTVNLPAGSAGDIVGLKDYAGTWDSNAVTINPNGSDKIGGGSAVDPTLTSEGGAVLLVYVDGIQGWLTTAESVTTSPSGVETFMVATGGTPCSGAIVCTNYKEHTFTGPGTFCVSEVSSTAANNAVAYLVVAGGGGAGAHSYSGGGGAGGFREGTTAPVVPYTASPIVAATGLTVTASPYPITVGAGGTSGTRPDPPGGGCEGDNGSDSIFSTITSAGGGGGGAYNPAPVASNPGNPGGSGGGGSANAGAAGAGDTPNVTPDQGFPGGVGSCTSGGAGGGATAVGATGGPSAAPPGGGNDGGAGATTNIPGSPITKSTGGRGAGGPNPGVNGGDNTGDGSFGHSSTGGSGIVVIRYKFQ